MDQLELNLEMVESGIARYRGKVKSSQDRGKESEAPYGQRLMRGALPKLIDEVAKRIEYHRKNPHAVPVWMPLVWDMEPETIGMLSLKCTLDCISIRRPLVSSAIRIASYIEDELHYRWLKTEHNEVFHYAAKDVEKDSKRSYRRKVDAFMRHERGEAKKGNMERWKTWSRRDKVAMGTWLLELIRTTTHYIAFNMIGERQKTVMYVTATDDLFAWIQRYNADQEVLRPLWLPTVEAPKDWVSVWRGGYDPDAGLPPLTLIKTYDMDYLRGLNTEDMKPVTDAVNHVQSTAWRVNEKVLEVARWAWDNDREIGEMCRRSDYELPPFPARASEDKELKKEYSRKCGTIHNLNLSMRSQRLHIIKTLWMAGKYAGKKFYYPHQLDFRGRLYPIPYFLSPQGTDLAKSLLCFDETQTIWQPETEARWLAIHGANQFGNDKVTFDERVAWVHSRKNEIFEVCKDPITNDWWTEADEPWQFLAFCFEWGAMLECGGRGFKTRLPVAMDASNNGIQILSLLGRDEVGGEATNVTQTDEPADLYSFVSDRVNELLLNRAKKGDHIATAWLKFGVDRKTTKRPVMVKPYGGTRYSCREYVAEWYSEKCLKDNLDPFGNESTIAIGQLAQLVWKAMDECLDRPNAVMKWLQDVARILGHEGKEVRWTSPLGFKIKQKYADAKSMRIRTLLGEKISFVKWREPLSDIDKIRQANGISPNFVHSLDASVAQSTTNYAKEQGINSLAMVHDSFATHCNKCDALGGIIRRSAAEIFTTDLLAGFRDEIKQQTQKELPDLPPYGSLDPHEVLGSDYFFA